MEFRTYVEDAVEAVQRRPIRFIIIALVLVFGIGLCTGAGSAVVGY